MNKSEIVANLYQTYQWLKENKPDYPLLAEFKQLLDYDGSQMFMPQLATLVELEKQHNLGKYFETIYQALSDQIQGLGRINWRAIGRRLNRYNPATASLRAAFSTLLKLNFMGYASKLKRYPDAMKKLEKKWVQLGGRVDHIRKAVAIGAKKKPLFAKVHGLGVINPQKLVRYTLRAKPILMYVDNLVKQKESKDRAKIEMKKAYSKVFESFEYLVMLNYQGLASKLKAYHYAYNALIDYYKKHGGNIGKLLRAINIGAKKRPIAGQEELGVIQIAALIKVAEPILSFLSSLFLASKKDAHKKDNSHTHTKKTTSQNSKPPVNYPSPANNTYKPVPPAIQQTQLYSMQQAQMPKQNQAKVSGGMKFLLPVGFGLAVAGGMLYLSKHKEEKLEPVKIR